MMAISGTSLEISNNPVSVEFLMRLHNFRNDSIMLQHYCCKYSCTSISTHVPLDLIAYDTQRSHIQVRIPKAWPSK